MFLDIDRFPSEAIAVIDDSGHRATYGELCDVILSVNALKLPRSVVFCLCENTLGSLLGYLAFEESGLVPLLLSSSLDQQLLAALDDQYMPSYYWVPSNLSDKIMGRTVASFYDYELVETGHRPYNLNENLSLLLTTSGSTGSAKLVRYKYGNCETNARNVASAFGWTSDERGICDLPMNYTMGLNVISSLLVAGGTVLLAKSSLVSPSFWDFIISEGGSSICGVPYSYEIMRRLGFDKKDLPSLKTLAQGGGRLPDKMFRWFAEFCNRTDRRFVATFGTTETSARMSFLPPELALEKTGSIGRAIPEGEMFLLDEDGSVTAGCEGELAYRGPNVTMGYALCRSDLAKGDEFCGEYHTGDLAYRDEDGCFYIIGRKGRFLKLFGLRVGLDEVERLVRSKFGCECACTGTDKRLLVYVTDSAVADQVVSFLNEKTGIHSSAFRSIVRESLPRNEYGKIRYSELPLE